MSVTPIRLQTSLDLILVSIFTEYERSRSNTNLVQFRVYLKILKFTSNFSQCISIPCTTPQFEGFEAKVFLLRCDLSNFFVFESLHTLATPSHRLRTALVLPPFAFVKSFSATNAFLTSHWHILHFFF